MSLQSHDSPSHVLDRHVLEELFAALGNDTGRVRNVYRKFLESAAARLEEARHQRIADSVATFHALKGSAGMVGANRVAALAARLQETAACLDNETKASAIGEIQAELDAFRGALGALLDALPTAK